VREAGTRERIDGFELDAVSFCNYNPKKTPAEKMQVENCV